LGCATFIIVGNSKQAYNKVILPIEKAMGIVYLVIYIYISKIVEGCVENV
jgi:hypothetical protein